MSYHEQQQPGHVEGERRKPSETSIPFYGETKESIPMKPIQTNCPICLKTLSEDCISLKQLKPRFLRQLQRIHSSHQLKDISCKVCIKDLAGVLQLRIDELLTEDSATFARLQEDSMRYMDQFVNEENTWQDQFEMKRTFGQKAADMVAKYGGSWGFVLGVITVIFLWTIANSILPKIQIQPWDPFPFILFNLFLSILAALQAPIILMSQNRSSQIEKAQTSYISRIILRGEHQTRQVNAKIDHLITNKWVGLLEIQEIQIDLLHILQTQISRQSKNTASTSFGAMTLNMIEKIDSPPLSSHTLMHKKTGSSLHLTTPTLNNLPWKVSTSPDDHARMLLLLYFSDAGYRSDNELLFSRWHGQGDNFFGIVQDVSLMIENLKVSKNPNFATRPSCWVYSPPGETKEFNPPSAMSNITYTIFLGDMNASLDDIISGEANLKLRNDFDIPHMHLIGTISRIQVFTKENPTSAIEFRNGELPIRYKPTFQNLMGRAERITDFWKNPLEKVIIQYIPPPQLAIVYVGSGWNCQNITVNFQSPFKEDEIAHLYMSTGEECVQNPLNLLNNLVVGVNVGEGLVTEENKRKIEWTQVAATNSPGKFSLKDLQLKGPLMVVFVCQEVGIDIQGEFVQQIK